MATKKKTAAKPKKQVKKKVSAKKAPAKKVTPKKKAPAKSQKKQVKKASAKPKKTPILQKNWLRGALLAFVLLVFSGGLVALTFQVWKAPSLVKILPASTIAFAEGDLTLWHPLENLLSEEEQTKDGVVWLATKAGGYEAVSFTYDKGWQASREITDEPPLKDDPDYLKMRPNLPYEPLMFAYFQPEAVWNLTGNQKLLAGYPTAATGLEFFSKVLGWFPVTGVAIDYLEDAAVVQTYTVGDKSLLDGDALFHLDEKYQGDLINYFPADTETFIGGQNLAATFLYTVKILNAVDGVGGWALYLSLQDKFEYYFGEEMDITEALSPLFENEYALSFRQGENQTTWLLAIQLTGKTTNIYELLKEKLLRRGLLEVNEELEMLEQIKLTLKENPFEDLSYFTVQLEDLTDFFHFFVYDDVLFISLDRSETEKALETISDKESEKLQIPAEIIQFADHVLVTHGDYQVNTGISIFDDGISTLHLIK